MTFFTQIYKSTDTNAPVLSGTAGALIALLDACLVNGYTTASVTSITRAGTTATATLAVANGTLATGHYVTISGAVQTDYNGTFQITFVDATHFTFTVANSPTTPATGTILYAKAALGWAKPFSGTNLAVYRSADPASNRFYLRLDETGSLLGGQKDCSVVGYETMSDVNNGTGLFPTPTTAIGTNLTGSWNWVKSSTADATARAWTLVGDGKTFYFFPQAVTATPGCGFGHFIPNKPGDGYCTFLTGYSNVNGAFAGINGIVNSLAMFNTNINTSGMLSMPRSYTQIGQHAFGKNVVLTNAATGNVWQCHGSAVNVTSQYPGATINPVDGSVMFVPVYIMEGTTNATAIFRGRFPGLFAMMGLVAPSTALGLSNYDQVPGGSSMPVGAILTAIVGTGNQNTSQQTGMVFLDTFGPWV